MKNINVCFPIAKKLLQPLGLKGCCRHDEKILQTALVYLCKNSSTVSWDMADNYQIIMSANFNKERKQYFISVRQELWAKLKKISRDTGRPLCKLMAWGVFCVQHSAKQMELPISAKVEKETKSTKDAIIVTLHKDLQRIIDDLLIKDDELWLVANRETRGRLLILVDMANYVYDLIKKESEKVKIGE